MSSPHAQRQRKLWKEARTAGEVIICGICGEPITRGKRFSRGGITVDHIVPLAMGGPDTIRNMQPAHQKCNQAKADRLSFKKREILSEVNRLIGRQRPPR
jgi:5-methylcytosine-specific restriction endonuclease McrA